MNFVEEAFQEFVEAIQSAYDTPEFERVAARLAHRIGFQRFAYLRLIGGSSTLISSYPKSWTSRYFQLEYQHLDPVVLRARVERDLFSWRGGACSPCGSRAQRQFFDEAMSFGIRSGLTVPIRAGYGQLAAFTLATDESGTGLGRFANEWWDIIHQAGLYLHVHASTRISAAFEPRQMLHSELTQRERQCLTWAAQGKTAGDISVLVGVTQRTVVFHLKNARRKLGASSIAQGVAIALTRGLLN